MAKSRKTLTQLIHPGREVWESRRLFGGDTAAEADEPVTPGEARFAKAAQRRVLVLPVSHAWVMPAWLKGDPAFLKDMAALHLERLGIRVEDPSHGMLLKQVAEKEDAHLTAILTLKDESSPLAAQSPLPHETTLSALLLPLPTSSITVWRELGRLVFGITVEDHLVYASPITASHFDSRALSEVNNACLQLGFQGVLGRVNDLVLWLEEGEGDEKEISQQTGLNVTREPFPEWPAPQGKPCPLMPADVRAMTHHREAVGRVRLLALSGGLVLAALVAVMMVLISVALKERNGLREKVAELTPRAARVEDQRASWEEAAPAVDPSRGPMQMLLHLMEPSVSADVTLMDFEFTPDRVLLRGHTKSASQALQYQQEIQQGESLMAYTWEAPQPELGSEESATFELKGERE